MRSRAPECGAVRPSFTRGKELRNPLLFLLHVFRGREIRSRDFPGVLLPLDVIIGPPGHQYFDSRNLKLLKTFIFALQVRQAADTLAATISCAPCAAVFRRRRALKLISCPVFRCTALQAANGQPRYKFLS